MIKRKEKICIDCGLPKIIWAHDRCKYCDAKFRLNNGSGSSLTYMPKPTGEMKMFDELIATRGAFSEIDGKPLLPKGHPKYHWQFEHVLPKGKYGLYRLNPRNIVLMTWDQHDFVRIHTGEAMKMPEYQWYFLLKEFLKKEYNHASRIQRTT